MGDQIRTLTLKCPSCGSGLEVSPDMERFSCGYCGTEQMVQRRGGTVSLKLITAAISKVQVGTDKTAAELALVRLQRELTELDSKPFTAPGPSWDWARDPAKGSAGSCAGGCIAVLLGLFGVGVIANALFNTDVIAKQIGKNQTSVFTTLVALGIICVVLAYKINDRILMGTAPSKESMASRAAWEAEAAKLSQQEKDRIQTERERIVSQIANNRAIVERADKGE